MFCKAKSAKKQTFCAAILDNFQTTMFKSETTSESLNILDIRLREVGPKRRLNGTSKVNRWTDGQTDRRTIGNFGRNEQYNFPIHFIYCVTFKLILIQSISSNSDISLSSSSKYKPSWSCPAGPCRPWALRAAWWGGRSRRPGRSCPPRPQWRRRSAPGAHWTGPSARPCCRSPWFWCCHVSWSYLK